MWVITEKELTNYLWFGWVVCLLLFLITNLNQTFNQGIVALFLSMNV